MIVVVGAPAWREAEPAGPDGRACRIALAAAERGSGVELIGRSGQVMTGWYPEVTAALRALPPGTFLIDGEIVALYAAGKASFQRLQSRMGLTNPHDIERGVSTVPVTAITNSLRSERASSWFSAPLSGPNTICVLP